MPRFYPKTRGVVYWSVRMLRTLLWAFVLVLALSFFGISLRAIIMSPAGQENFGYVYHLLVQFWDWILGIFLKV